MLDMRERLQDSSPRGDSTRVGTEFRSGLRAHIDRGVVPVAEPAPREADPEPQPIEPQAAPANVAVQRVVYELANAIVDGTVAGLPQDELARARARRGGFAA
jgi:hypothetical protein